MSTSESIRCVCYIVFYLFAIWILNDWITSVFFFPEHSKLKKKKSSLFKVFLRVAVKKVQKVEPHNNNYDATAFLFYRTRTHAFIETTFKYIWPCILKFIDRLGFINPQIARKRAFKSVYPI